MMKNECDEVRRTAPAAEREGFKNRVAEQLREKIEQILTDPKKSA